MNRQVLLKIWGYSPAAASPCEFGGRRRAVASLERNPDRSSPVQSEGEQFAAKIQFRMPREHGAWGILLVPLLCSAMVASNWKPPLFLFVVCALAFFLLCGSLEGHRPRNRWKALLAPIHLLLAAAGFGAGALLIAFHQRYELLWLGLVAAGLYGIQRWLLRRHGQERAEKRSLPAELVGAALLTLTAPAAWIAARGSLLAKPPGTNWDNLVAVKVWLLNLLFFIGGILYVKYRVRGLLVHRKFGGIGQRIAFAWPAFLYYLLLAAFLIIAGVLDRLPVTVLLAFTPGIVRANRLAFHLGQRFPIRRLGWTEIAHAAVFGALLMLAFRFS